MSAWMGLVVRVSLTLGFLSPAKEAGMNGRGQEGGGGGGGLDIAGDGCGGGCCAPFAHSTFTCWLTQHMQCSYPPTPSPLQPPHSQHLTHLHTCPRARAHQRCGHASRPLHRLHWVGSRVGAGHTRLDL